MQLGTVKTDDFELFARGDGAIHVDDLHSDHLTVDLSGNGDVWLSGATDNADVGVHGNGSLHADEPLIEELAIDVTGSGDATVHVTDSISGEVSGSGNLDVLGDPDGEVTASGSGVITWL